MSVMRMEEWRAWSLTDTCVLKTIKLVVRVKAEVFAQMQMPVVSEAFFASSHLPRTEIIREEEVLAGIRENVQLQHQLDDVGG